MGKNVSKNADEYFDAFFSKEQARMSMTLPDEITRMYTVVSCISETNLHKSYLLEDKTQHCKVLLKTGEGEYRSLLKIEAEVGENVRTVLGEKTGKVISYLEIDRVGYLLRQYIEGMNLMEYMERRSILTAGEIYDIIHILCHKISILHQQNPPVIHRDIKPENLIVHAKKGRILDVYIIDYGTARVFDADKEHDTVFVATRQTAAPEQYGFSQTDERTDIYGIGKVLCYMLTGEFDVRNLKRNSGGMLYHLSFGSMRTFAKCSPVRTRVPLCSLYDTQLSMTEYLHLQRVVAKATALDPDMRYQSVKQLEKACQKGYHLAKTGRVAIGGVCILFLMGIAFFMGTKWGARTKQSGIESAINTVSEDVKPEDTVSESTSDRILSEDAVPEDMTSTKDTVVEVNEDGAVVFESELLKEAVAQQFPEGTTITADKLSEINSIRIIGKKVCTQDDLIVSGGDLCVNGVDYQGRETGDVTDLSVIMQMDHLDELYLGYQGISDISGLEGWTGRTLLLTGNEIEDFSVIGTMPNLENLYIGDNPAKTIPDLSGLANLRVLNIERMKLDDLESLRGLPVQELEIYITEVSNNDYTALADMDNLYRLGTNFPESGLVDAIGELPGLKYLEIYEWPEKDFTKLSNLSQLVGLHSSSQRLETFAGITNLQNLQDVYMSGCLDLRDVSGIETVPHLQRFVCNSNVIEDITPLCNLSDWLVELRLGSKTAKRVVQEKPELSELVTIED